MLVILPLYPSILGGLFLFFFFCFLIRSDQHGGANDLQSDESADARETSQ